MNHFTIAMFLSVLPGFVAGASAQEQSPGASEQLMELADKAHLRGDYEEAVRIQSRALEQNTAFHAALLRRATTLRIMGKYKEAAADYEVILHLTPLSAWQGYAELLATCPDKEIRDPPRAIKLATKALNLVQTRFPKSQAVAELMDTLAAAHAQQGKFDEAIRWQKKAIGLSHEARHKDMRSRLELYESGKPYFYTPPALRKTASKN